MFKDSSKPTILITGANGFIGSWAVKTFATLEYPVIALVRPDSNLARLVEWRQQTLVADEKSWPGVISRIEPEIVILGDWAGVAGNLRDDELQAENVTRWELIAQACKDAAVGRLIGLGSQAELGDFQLDATESHPLSPQTKYGLAKVEALYSLNEILNGSSTKLTWVRLFSVYGPDINLSWIIPQAITAIRQKKQIDLTSCEQEWNFLHVKDLMELLVKITQLDNPPPIIHAADHESRPLRDYLITLGELAGGSEFLGFGNLDPYSSKPVSLRPNTDLSKSIGWVPKTDWSSGIEEILNAITLES
jgi:nucleoside-diphosphate-sugar epimerase